MKQCFMKFFLYEKMAEKSDFGLAIIQWGKQQKNKD